MNETAKRILKTAGIILLAVILILVIYLLYLVISYHRIEDNLALQVETSDEGGQQETKKLTTGEQDNRRAVQCLNLQYRFWCIYTGF